MFCEDKIYLGSNLFFPVSRTITSGLMDALPNLFFRLADHPGGGRSSGTILARLNGSSFPSVPKTTLGGGLLPRLTSLTRCVISHMSRTCYLSASALWICLIELMHAKCPAQCVARGRHSTNTRPIPLPFLPEMGLLMPGRGPHNFREVHQVHECFRDLGVYKGEDGRFPSHHCFPGSLV